MNKAVENLAFVDYNEEQTKIVAALTEGKPVAVISPPDYGRQGLIQTGISQSGFHAITINLLLVVNSALLERYILDGVGELLYKLLPKTKKPQENLLKHFRAFKPEVSILDKKVQLSVSEKSFPEVTIVELLKCLDEAAKKIKKRVIIYIDEFQQIKSLPNSQLYQDTICKAVKASTNVSYIFSGSFRHELLPIFTDRIHTLSQITQIIRLKRKSEDNLKSKIQNESKKKWGKIVKDESISTILKLTERHPHYIQQLCTYFWERNEYPTQAKIKAYWETYASRHSNDFIPIIAKLSNNQKVVLKDLALRPTNQPLSLENTLRTRLTAASQRQSIEKLKTLDMLFEDELGFLRVFNPVVRSLTAKL